MTPHDLFSVVEVASRLNLHVRTVRNYVREGRLKATRIGKQYRISRADLEAFTGHPVPLTGRELASRQRRIEVSSVVQVDALSPEDAAQLADSLSSFVYGRKPDVEALRIETMYDRHLGRMKIMLFGSPSGTAAVLKLAAALMEG